MENLNEALDVAEMTKESIHNKIAKIKEKLDPLYRMQNVLKGFQSEQIEMELGIIDDRKYKLVLSSFDNEPHLVYQDFKEKCNFSGPTLTSLIRGFFTSWKLIVAIIKRMPEIMFAFEDKMKYITTEYESRFKEVDSAIKDVY